MIHFEVYKRNFDTGDLVPIDQCVDLTDGDRVECYMVHRARRYNEPIMELDWQPIGKFHYGEVAHMHRQPVTADRHGYYCLDREIAPDFSEKNIRRRATTEEIPPPKVRNNAPVEYRGCKWWKRDKYGGWIAAERAEKPATWQQSSMIAA